MKYYPPLGAEDDNADYENCDPVNHKWENSMPDARGFGATQREIVNAITTAGLTPSADDLTQLSQAVLKIAQKGLFNSTGDGLTIDNGVLKAVIAAGLIFSAGKIAVNTGKGLSVDEDNKLNANIGPALVFNEANQLALNLHDSLQILNSQLAQAYLISSSKVEDMADNVIRPQITRTILRKSITAATTFTFDNSAIANIPDGTHVTLELHLNMKTVSAISFSPGVEWDGGKAPTMNKVRDYWLVLRTENKGASWKASLGSDFNGY